MAGVLIQVSEKDGGIGEVLLLAILVLAVVAAVGCMMMMFPILVAIRHGWRWMLATIAATSLAGWPLRVAFDSEEITHSWWGLISFPLWMAVAVVAWRGPPDWFSEGEGPAEPRGSHHRGAVAERRISLAPPVVRPAR